MSLIVGGGGEVHEGKSRRLEKLSRRSTLLEAVLGTHLLCLTRSELRWVKSGDSYRAIASHNHHSDSNH